MTAPDRPSTASPLRAGSLSSGARDLAFAFFRLSWSTTRRRGSFYAQDRLASSLVASPRVRRLLVADAPHSVFGILEEVLRRRRVGFPASPGRSHSAYLRLGRGDPDDLAELRHLYRRYGRHLSQAADRAALERPALLTTSMFVAGFSPLDWAGRVTLHLTDDFLAHAPSARWWPAYEAALSEIRARELAVTAVSDRILERVAPSGPSRVVPNGIEEAEWESLPPMPEWLRCLPEPRLVYVGALDDRIDTECVQSVARAVPGCSIALVGYHRDQAHIARLRQIPGVHILPAVGRADLVATIAGADACLLPHRRTSLTEAMSPLKVYEYLAGGRPVAAIDLPPFRGLSTRIVHAAGPSEFGDAVRQALEVGAVPEDERRAFVRENGWTRRHAEILDVALRD